ncbi:hypothetical protein HOA87_06720 [bacterium]|nr:hypothetical protein [bacterium]MBT4249418.1 hypothetical protein [bacterium]MBT6777656.1 hypothetical protein [bacterium]|tara:strand:+ start:1027 stop:1647 length:621 start_codon:yes stop_codon:yes gene_type:complete
MKKYIILLLPLLFFAACSDEETNDELSIPNFDGTYTMTNRAAGTGEPALGSWEELSSPGITSASIDISSGSITCCNVDFSAVYDDSTITSQGSFIFDSSSYELSEGTLIQGDIYFDDPIVGLLFSDFSVDWTISDVDTTMTMSSITTPGKYCEKDGDCVIGRDQCTNETLRSNQAQMASYEFSCSNYGGTMINNGANEVEYWRFQK